MSRGTERRRVAWRNCVVVFDPVAGKTISSNRGTTASSGRSTGCPARLRATGKAMQIKGNLIATPAVVHGLAVASASGPIAFR
jgi:hypothetical protein